MESRQDNTSSSSSPVRSHADVCSDPPCDENATPPSSPPPRLPLPGVKPRRSVLSRKQSLKQPCPSSSKAVALPLGEITNMPISAPTTRPTKKKQAKRLTQLQIDLGQDMRRCCKTCGMDYIPSNGEDAALHRSFHYMNVGGVDLGRSTVQALSARRHGAATEPATSKSRGGVGAWTATVDAKSSLAERKVVRRVLDVVTADMAAVEIPDGELWSSVSLPPPECPSLPKPHTVENAPRFKAYLYIRASKCIGFCLAERIAAAFPVLQHAPPLPSSSSSSSSPTTQRQAAARTISMRSSSVSVSTKKEPATLGISRIWTSSQHRRSGVASALLECAQTNFVFGMRLPKRAVAFSQPTGSGGRLAARWFAGERGWKVYLED